MVSDLPVLIKASANLASLCQVTDPSKVDPFALDMSKVKLQNVAPDIIKPLILVRSYSARVESGSRG